MSLYGEYVLEHSNDEIIETDKGFATYRFLDNKVYLIDIYVKPEFRKSGYASALADAVVDVAKQRDCVQLLGSVVPSAKNSTASLRVLLGYGMTLDSSSNDFIVFKKDIAPSERD